MLKAHHRHYAAGFLTDCAVMINIMALPFYIYDRLHGGAAMSGAVGGAQAIAYGALCLLLSMGWLPLARTGLRIPAAGVAVFGLAFVASTFVHNPVLYGAMTTVGMGALAFVWPSLHAWIGAEPNLRRRNRRMSRFNLSWSLGFTVGPLVAGPLFAIDPRLPFYVSCALASVTVVILLLAPDERAYFGTAPAAAAAEDRVRHDRASEVHLLTAWIANLVGNGLAQVTRSVFPKRIEDLVSTGQLRLFFEAEPSSWLASQPSTNYMWLAFVVAAANAVTFMFMGRTRGWHHRFSVLAAMQGAAACAFWVLGRTHSLAVMMVCFALVGVAWGGGFFAAVYYSVSNPLLKHRRAAINEGAVGLGGFIGSLSFGYMVERYGHGLPYAWTPLCVAAVVAIEWLLLRQGARRHAIVPTPPAALPSAPRAE